MRSSAIFGPYGKAEALAHLAQTVVSIAADIPLDEIRATSRRCASVALARQVAMYLTHVTFGFSLAQVGTAFGRDRTTASHACQIVEDRRDDERFDAWITQLECALESVPRGAAAPPRPGRAVGASAAVRP